MCRNIKTLFNFAPPASQEEIRAASVQFIRKVCGSTRPSKANQPVFDQAVEDITGIVSTLLDNLVTSAEPKNREAESEKARHRRIKRFGAESTAVLD